MKKLLALIAVLSMSLGCATMLDIGRDLCDLALGGSKIGSACAQLDKLGGDKPAGEEVVE